MNQQTISFVVSEYMSTMPEALGWCFRYTFIPLIAEVSCPWEATPWDTPAVEGTGL